MHVKKDSKCCHQRAGSGCIVPCSGLLVSLASRYPYKKNFIFDTTQSNQAPSKINKEHVSYRKQTHFFQSAGLSVTDDEKDESHFGLNSTFTYRVGGLSNLQKCRALECYLGVKAYLDYSELAGFDLYA